MGAGTWRSRHESRHGGRKNTKHVEECNQVHEQDHARFKNLPPNNTHMRGRTLRNGKITIVIGF